MSFLYNTILVRPIYNTLIIFFKIIPSAESGLAVICVTLLVRLILFPLSRKAVRAQVEMQTIAPELEEIKKKYKDNQEEQAKRTLALYRERKINPFSGILVLIIQLPIILALYHIFLSSGFPSINPTLIYSFIKAPEHLSALFLGINLTQKSIILALFAAATTYFQLKLASSALKKTNNPSLGNDLARSMQTQMKYFFPLLVFFIAYRISGVVALYWLTTNLFTIGQEIVVRKKLKAQA